MSMYVSYMYIHISVVSSQVLNSHLRTLNCTRFATLSLLEAFCWLKHWAAGGVDQFCLQTFATSTFSKRKKKRKNKHILFTKALASCGCRPLCSATWTFW